MGAHAACEGFCCMFLQQALIGFLHVTICHTLQGVPLKIICTVCTANLYVQDRSDVSNTIEYLPMWAR